MSRIIISDKTLKYPPYQIVLVREQDNTSLSIMQQIITTALRPRPWFMLAKGQTPHLVLAGSCSLWWHTQDDMLALADVCAIKEVQYGLQFLTWSAQHLPIYLINVTNLDLIRTVLCVSAIEMTNSSLPGHCFKEAATEMMYLMRLSDDNCFKYMTEKPTCSKIKLF